MIYLTNDYIYQPFMTNDYIYQPFMTNDYIYQPTVGWLMIMVFNATFNNISVISWRLLLDHARNSESTNKRGTINLNRRFT